MGLPTPWQTIDENVTGNHAIDERNSVSSIDLHETHENQHGTRVEYFLEVHVLFEISNMKV